MKKILSARKVYFILYGLFVVVSSISLLLFSKVEIHLYFNSLYTGFGDVVFKYLTHLGDGIALVLVTVLLLALNKRAAMQVALSGIISGIIAQVLKKLVFGPTPRPSRYFENLDIPLRYVDGVELHTVFSFPSGHSTAAFALMTSLLFIFPKRGLGVFWMLLALLTAYSRIYLSQHFLSDILLGSIIGVITAILINLYLNSSSVFSNKKWDKPLINLSKK